eukprot:5438035-Amphidinium_carterae.1
MEREKVTKVTTTTTTANRKAMAKERTKEMEENRKDHHYHPATRTTGKERKGEKETRTSCVTTV